MPSRVSKILPVALALMWGCGGSGGGTDTPTGPTGPSPSTAVTITIVGERGAQSFSPNPASAGGRMVVFRNADTVVHRVRLNDGAVDTGDIAPGASSQPVMMPSAGTNYHCSLHPAMVGAVSSATGPPPVCQGPYC
jgi:plastocyanin